MSAANWAGIVVDALGIGVEIARLLGGAEGAEVAKRVEEILRDASFPTLRRVAREVGETARERLGDG